jgi:hypothetical protein
VNGAALLAAGVLAAAVAGPVLAAVAEALRQLPRDGR